MLPISEVIRICQVEYRGNCILGVGLLPYSRAKLKRQTYLKCFNQTVIMRETIQTQNKSTLSLTGRGKQALSSF